MSRTSITTPWCRQRGVLNLYPHRRSARRTIARRGNAIGCMASTPELLDRDTGESVGALSRFRQRSLPVQRRPSCSRAAAPRVMTLWSGAMRAPPTGVASTSSENCEVTGAPSEENGKIIGRRDERVYQARGSSLSVRRQFVPRGEALAGLRLPIESYALSGLCVGKP